MAAECTALGPFSASPHLTSRFTIKNANRVAGLDFKVSVVSTSPQGQKSVTYGNVVGVGDGMYTALFCVRYACTCELTVTLGGNHIVGSPFQVAIRS